MKVAGSDERKIPLAEWLASGAERGAVLRVGGVLHSLTVAPEAES